MKDAVRELGLKGLFKGTVSKRGAGGEEEE